MTSVRIITYYWSINARGIMIIFALFAVIAGSVLYLANLRSSPVVATSTVKGHVLSAITREAWPEQATGRGFSYRYGIRLENSDTVVFAVQGAARPIAIGTAVRLERIERENGSLDYRFIDRTGRR